MLSNQRPRLECTELGDACEREESNSNRRLSPPAENRGEPTGGTTQPHDIATPPQMRMTDNNGKGTASGEKLKGTRGRRATPGSKPSTLMTRDDAQKGGGRKTNQQPPRRNDKPLYKHFRITHLNCRRNREALNKLLKIRARDDILIASETPVRDSIPMQLAGYTSIHHIEEPRICA